ncbi:MAG: hypothetical protein V7636_397 [Actinomycetota bacterium]
MSSRVPRFAEDSVLRRIYRENVLFLGGGRALLLQLAHPDVARGVTEHSSFEEDPFSRLRRTITVVDAIVFGDDDDADRAADGLRRVHHFVTGPGYEANDPALLFWVHATLVDTGMRIYNGFVAPLSDADRERAHADAITLAEVFGVPRTDQPATYADFRAYMRSMVATLEVTDTARAVARSVLHPRLPAITSPALELVRQVTVGLLPRPIREQYGFRWDARRKAALHAAALASRVAHPLLPRALRWGDALSLPG